jgi:hypothetical protein
VVLPHLRLFIFEAEEGAPYSNRIQISSTDFTNPNNMV